MTISTENPTDRQAPDAQLDWSGGQGRAERPKLARRTFLVAGGGTLLAAAGGTGWALNRFVIEHVEVTNASAQQPANATVAQAGTGTATSDSYTSDTASLTITARTSGSGNSRLAWFVADITVSDATIVRSAFAQDKFGENIVANPSVIAEQAGAVLAINGDYYGFRDKGARQGLAFRTDGSMTLYDETATSAAKLLKDGVWNTLSFGPGLVENGDVIDGIDDIEIDTNVGNHSVQGNQPRTGVGVIAPNHFLFLVVDGRSAGYSRGASMTEFAQMFVDEGAQVAYNLDGGGSSAMVFNGSLVNNPLGRGRERGTSDILYVAG